MLDRTIDVLMALFWLGLLLGLASAAAPALAGLARAIVLLAGNAVAALALLGVAYVVATTLPRLVRRG